MTKEILKLALEALEDLGMKHFESTGEVLHKKTFTAIKEALAQPEQRPVAFVKGCNRGQWEIFPAKAHQIFGIEQPLYTTPPQRTWVGLTDKVITKVIDSMPKKMRGFMDGWDLYDFTRAIEAKHKENNHG